MTAVEVATVEDGPRGAPLVVLAGSLGSTTAMWDPQVPALATEFRVVRFDTRGHGRSPVPPGPYSIDDLADDLLALLDHLGADRAHLVGLSLGGMTVLRFAARNPDRVDRAAVLCTSALLGPAQAWADRAATVRAQGTAAVADAVVARWFTDRLRAADPGLVAWARDMVAAQPADGYAECCGVVERMDLRASLPSIRAPLLAVAGAQDPATPLEHLDAIVAAVPHAQLAVVDAAHMAGLEQPAAVNALLLEHLTGSQV